MNAEHHRFVFIGGLHRSGTSLLFKILRENPDISGFHMPGGTEKEHEGQHLQDVYPSDQETGGPGYFGLAENAHITEESPLVCEQSRQRLLDSWSPYWDLGKTFLLEKSPTNFLQMRFLQAIFGECCFIVLVRHPVAVSLATLKWMGWPSYRVEEVPGQQGVTVRPAVPEDVRDFNSSERLMMQSMLYSLFRHWQHAHQTMMGDLSKVSNVSLVRYEELVSEPEEIIRALTSRIGAKTGRNALNIEVEDRNTRYFRQWGVMQGSLVSPRVLSFFSSTFGDSFRQFGYELSDNGIKDWSPHVASSLIDFSQR